MTVTTEQLASTLSEALFHYREALVLKESERDKVLPQKGKLPATDDDDALQAEYNYQLEAINRFLGSVDEMVAAIDSPRESKSVVKYQAPAHPQWLEPYLKDESFINPFTGLIVEAPDSPNTISSKPGPSTKEGPLKEIPPTFWDNYDPNRNPSLVKQKTSTVPSYSKDTNVYRSGLRVGDIGRMDPYEAALKSIPTDGKLSRFHQAQIRNPGLGDIRRQNDSNLPGTWVNSWANSTDEDLDKAPVAGPSTLSRTTSKILGGPWKTWAHRTNPFAAIQLKEMQGNKAGAKATIKHEKGKRPNEQWITAPETQIDEAEKTVRFSTTAASFEIGGDGFQLYNGPTGKRPVTFSRPSILKNSISSSSSIETSSSGASSTLQADLLADDERQASEFKPFRDFSSTGGAEPSHPLKKDPVPVQVVDNPLDSPDSSRQEYGFPEYSPKSTHGSSNRSHSQTDFQIPSNLFDDEDGGSGSSSLLREQLQRDRELAEMISAGLDPDMDPETFELIKRLSQDSPQDFNQLLDQEAEREALLAELTSPAPPDLHVLQDWELAMQLAEGSPQDMEEHMRQIREQEEFARLEQEAWDEDIRRMQREEIVRLEEEERRERMADCTACSEEGEKIRMAMLPCDHGYCSTCIRLAFEGALKEKKPFRCCDQVPIDSVTAHFPQHFIRDYNDLMLELNTQNPLYCSARGCSKFIPPTSIRGDTGTCRTCNSNTCRHCRAPAHAGICSEDEDSTAVLGLAKEKGWKACPGCKNMIERVDGCLHMTCTRCPNRTEFCYNCGQLYSQCPGTCRR